VVLEQFHAGPAKSPFRLPLSHLSEPGRPVLVTRREGKLLDRMLLPPNILFRRWGMETQERVEGSVPVRAIVAVGLHERPSMVRFFNWGRVHESQAIAGCPTGLRAWVWWPELQQDLYGISWVENEALSAAREWTRQAALDCFELLRLEPPAHLESFASTRAAYGSEIRLRLRAWLGGPQ
jgi:hypothetical protein